MSQSAIACYVVTFSYPQADLAENAKLNNQLMLGGFATTVADSDGIPHELGPNSYAITSLQDKSDVERLAQALGKVALGQEPEVEAVLRDEYFTQLWAARNPSKGRS